MGEAKIELKKWTQKKFEGYHLFGYTPYPQVTFCHLFQGLPSLCSLVTYFLNDP